MDEALKLINDNIIVVVAAFLGSAMKDILDYIGNRSSGHRILKFVINVFVTVIIVLFVFKSIFPGTSWQVLSGISIGFSFIAFRVADYFASTLAVLRLIPGGDKIREAMKKEEEDK